jgi:hypothetical protein
MKHLFGISGQEEILALKQLEKERRSFWQRMVDNYHKRQRLNPDQLEDLAQAMGEI